MARVPKITPGMKRDALRSCSFFAPMESEQLSKIVEHCVERHYKRKATIFRRGDSGSSLMAVLTGAVDICVDAPDASGKKITYRRVEKGEIFGEIALLDGKPRTADAIAAKETTVVMVDRQVFMPMLRADEALMVRMFAVLCSRVRTTSIALEEVALFDVPTRLARVLLRMAREYGRPRREGGVVIGLDLSDQELSYLLGAPARETVNRRVNDWQRAGIIARVDNQYVILDVDRLEALASAEAELDAPSAKERATRQRA